ncbi:Gfo/Idh/MocA family protein [Alistipes sp. i18-0019-D1]|jgi:NDP-hexose-3-ketoreductase|uniref:Gfo/Idh/MocA family protein n=1 Tax=Alistipes sp. i18-0019-D1 TaxID=3132707 RepID=UPI0036F2F615
MIRIGIICPSEIAFRRFLPSLRNVKEFTFAGVAIASPAEWAGAENVTDKTCASIENERIKAQPFIDIYGGKIFEGYETMIRSDEIDAVYLPLPPALHFKWTKRVLECGKHAFVEKPFTTDLTDTRELLRIAEEKGLAVHENYMFVYHNQLKAIDQLIEEGEIGKVRCYRISFGFPRRASSDFRYNKVLGGGALLDAGGYCIKYADHLLGESARLVHANSYYECEFDVDVFGSATMVNRQEVIVQMSFGMDNDYKCELEAWGSTGTLTTGRILTAPDGLKPEMIIKHNQKYATAILPADNAFEKSIRRFYECLADEEARKENYRVIERQSTFVDDFKRLSASNQSDLY